MIIFINGVSSSGKTTIAKALQQLYSNPLLYMGLDTFLQTIPPQYLGSGEKTKDKIKLIIKREGIPITKIVKCPYEAEVCNTAPKIIDVIAKSGHNIVFDEVLLEDERLQNYVKNLNNHIVYFVGIHCSTEALSKRELLRKDRTLGLYRKQINRVHGPTRFYDLELDTTKKTAFDCAKEILDYVEKTPQPRGFKKLYEKFYSTNKIQS